MKCLFLRGGAAVLSLAFTAALCWAAIQGTVQDSSGAAVPHARIYVLQQPFPSRAVTADSAGAFRFPDLGAGRCTVFASAPGLSGGMVQTPCDSSEPLVLTLHPSAVAETVVVTAERTDVSSAGAASSTSVVTSDDVRAMQAMELFEAFRYLPGVEVNQTGRYGSVTGIFIRGAGSPGSSNYNLVAMDGVPINDVGGAYNFASLPPELIDRVELVRGPQAALYGPYGIGGAVQVITPSGLEHHDFFSSVEGGNFGTRRFTAGGGGQIGDFGLYGSLSRLQSDGVAANDDSRIDNAHLKADYVLHRRHHFQYSFLADSNESGNPGAFGSDPAHLFPGIDTVSRTFENYDVHAFHYDAQLGSRINQRLTGGVYSDRLDFHSPFGPSFSRQSRNSLSSETGIALAGHDVLIFGMDWSGERFRNTFLTDAGSTFFPVERSFFGWFVENHLEWRGKLFLNAGARLEYIRRNAIPPDAFGSRPFLPEDREAEAHPKLSAAYLLLATTRLHGSVGTGLRPPNGFELTFTTNPALRPERTVSFDAGLAQSFWDHRIMADVTWFYSRFRDQIVTLSPAAQSLSHWTSDNLANSEAGGVEAALYIHAGRNLRLRGAYTYLDTAVLSLDGSSTLVQGIFRLGQQLIRRPRHSGSYMAVWQQRRLLVETGAVLHGRTLDVEPNFAAGEYLNPFYATFDAGAQFEISRGVALTAKVRNLLDRTYEESLGFPALGRNFTVGVKWRWLRE